MKTCNWPGCDLEVGGAYCSQHWFTLPKKIRDDYKEARSGKDRADALLDMRLWIQKNV